MTDRPAGPSEHQEGNGGPTGLRLLVRRLIGLAVLGFAVHFLLPQVAGLEQGLRALREGRWSFLSLTFGGVGLAYLAGAWMVRASVDVPPPWARTTIVQVAASAAAALTPMGIGWVAVTQGYLQKEGTDEHTARAATAFNMAMTMLSHGALLLVLLPFLSTLHLPKIHLPARGVFVDAAVALAVVAGLLFWIPRLRSKAASVVKPILEAIPRVAGDPRRATKLALAAVGTNLAYGLALYGAVAAFGPTPPPLGTLVAYLLAATVASIAPTPGGLGATETALVAALTRLDVPAGQAIAAALSFRVVTFWVPLAVGSLLLRRAKTRAWI